jgi:Tol biopolymer transport system component
VVRAGLVLRAASLRRLRRRCHHARSPLSTHRASASEARRDSEFWNLAWSPNGDLVAFEVDDTKLLVRDVATGADTSLLDVTRWSERLHVIEFSPDGDRILFTRSDADGDPSPLWSIGVDGADLRRLVDGIDWADLQPQGRPS